MIVAVSERGRLFCLSKTPRPAWGFRETKNAVPIGTAPAFPLARSFYFPETLISPTYTDGLPMPEPGKMRSLPTARMFFIRS